MNIKVFLVAMVVLACASVQAQVNSGSNGSDGALDFSNLTNLGYSTNVVINMADHPTGIYNYTFVNIPTNVTVSFIPNANNTPVYWLVQSNVVINGTVDASGQSPANTVGGIGGPGGWCGGSVGSNGEGPGGGGAGGYAAGGSYAGQGVSNGAYGGSTPGIIYGNIFLLPLAGGSGGGGGSGGFYGSSWSGGGGGGGGAILIASSSSIQVNGSIKSNGGNGHNSGGGGSGGGIRFVAPRFEGVGIIDARGGNSGVCNGGYGRIRVDTFRSAFGGAFDNPFNLGSQFVIFPNQGQGAQLTIASVDGVPVSASPTGQIVTPDAVLSAQQTNPIPVMVSCANLPLNSLITVSIKPANGSTVTAIGYNSTGTQASSSATIPIVIPRGGGLVYATAATSN